MNERKGELITLEALEAIRRMQSNKKGSNFGLPADIPPGKVIELYPKGYKKPPKLEKPGLSRKERFIKKVAVPMALVAAGAVTEATFHPIQNAVNKADAVINEANASYKIGQLVNPNKVYEVHLINSFNQQGQTVEPKALVTIDGEIKSISLDDPSLSSFDRNSLRGFLRVDEGDYKVRNLTNPDYKKNLATAFNLPKDIGAHFNRIPVEEGMVSRAIYFEPAGVLYTINGRDFLVRFPLISVQPPLSTGS